MYAIAAQVQDWLSAGRSVRIAQVVATKGFSSRDPGDALAWVDGEPPVGSLLDGVLREPLDGLGLVEVTIADADARGVGLSCGGSASVLVQQASAYPAEVWDDLLARRPMCLTSALDGSPDVTRYTTETIRGAFPPGDEVPRLFGRGTSATALVEDRAVVCLWPVPTLVVVGDGLIADALAGTAAVLGWHTTITVDLDTAVGVAGELHRSDAYVVLSHNRSLDGPALASALDGNAGYIGALGSRRTQAARGEWLTEHGVSDDVQARIHGPAGLDLDAHTPGEIAISIVAEILAERTGSGGVALRDRPGPVHTSGVQAPPPRYAPGTPRQRDAPA